MTKRIVTFGEIMMRLNPAGYYRFQQAELWESSYAGGEANVAVSLASFGMNASFVTKVPPHEMGKAAVNTMRRYGVDVSSVVYGGSRLGLYYVEKGASQRPSKVIYDRVASSIAEASRSDFDWDAIFEGVDWFHFTGITPALGGCLPELCLEACKAAQTKGIMISCDLNYRGKLWSREQAEVVMSNLMPYVDVCIANESDAADVFGISAEGSDVESGKIDASGYTAVAKKLIERFGFKSVAITLRGSLSASINDWGGMLYQNGQAYFSNRYTIQIVDRVGGGDSFCAGLIFALLSGFDGQKAIDFAVAASCLKHTIEHDFNLVSVEEVLHLVSGNTSGRVQR